MIYPNKSNHTISYFIYVYTYLIQLIKNTKEKCNLYYYILANNYRKNHNPYNSPKKPT